jgi:molybdate transport system permease protein
MEEAFRFCSDLVVLDGGRVIASGPRRQLFERPETVAAARLTGCKNIVPAQRMAHDQVAVEAWDCQLVTSREVPGELTHVGFRSHQFVFQQAMDDANTFPCWLVDTSEAPHEMTLYLRLHSSPQAGEPAHVQADVPKDLWRILSAQPQPWRLKFEPERLLLLQGSRWASKQ